MFAVKTLRHLQPALGASLCLNPFPFSDWSRRLNLIICWTQRAAARPDVTCKRQAVVTLDETESHPGV